MKDAPALGLFLPLAHGAIPDGARDCIPAIEAAADAAVANGRGTVYFHDGEWLLGTVGVNTTTPILPRNGLTYRGQSKVGTVFKPAGKHQAFYFNTAATDQSRWLTDVTFENFSVNGHYHNNTGGYTSAMKAIQVNRGVRIIQRDIYAVDTGATAYGSDDLVDTVFDNCIAVNCGRFNDGTGPGGAGIGYGVGVVAKCNVVIQNCVTIGCGTNGVFIEQQAGVKGQGIKIINHYSAGKHVHGIADAGCDGLQVIGGVSTGNTQSGFAVYRGTYSGATGPGINGRVIGLDTNGNGKHGVTLDSSVNAINGYVVENCSIWGNTERGIYSSGSASFTRVTLRNKRIYSNGHSGIELAAASTTYLEVSGNRCFTMARPSARPTAPASRSAAPSRSSSCSGTAATTTRAPRPSGRASRGTSSPCPASTLRQTTCVGTWPVPASPAARCCRATSQATTPAGPTPAAVSRVSSSRQSDRGSLGTMASRAGPTTSRRPAPGTRLGRPRHPFAHFGAVLVRG